MLLDIVCDFLSLFEHILQDELSAGVLEDGVGDLCDGETKVLNSVVCKTRVDDSVVDCRIDVYRDVILCYHVLKGNTEVLAAAGPKRGSWC